MAEVVDAHVHVACADGRRFPRRPTGVGSEWWATGGDAADVVRTVESNGVGRAVVVQAIGLYGYDCRCAEHVVGASDGRLALVAAVDMQQADPAAALPGLRDRGATGVRLFGVGADEPVWLGDGRGDAVWDAAGDLGLVVVPTLWARHLGVLGELCTRHPSIAVAVDHCGFPDLAGPDGERALFDLAGVASIHLKVTSHNLHAASDPAVWLGRLVEAFGADRLCWGSDHPQHQSLTYAEMLGLASSAAGSWGDAARRAFLAGTSLRLWWGISSTRGTSAER